MYLTKVKLELAQVFHLNWDEGLHLDLVAIKSCEVSCACGIPTHRNVMGLHKISVAFGSSIAKKKKNHQG